MKLIAVVLLVALVLAVSISGCVKQPEGPPTGGLTQKQAEDQALQTLEQEMEQNIEDMALEELENELLQQG